MKTLAAGCHWEYGLPMSIRLCRVAVSLALIPLAMLIASCGDSPSAGSSSPGFDESGPGSGAAARDYKLMLWHEGYGQDLVNKPKSSSSCSPENVLQDSIAFATARKYDRLVVTLKDPTQKDAAGKLLFPYFTPENLVADILAPLEDYRTNSGNLMEVCANLYVNTKDSGWTYTCQSDPKLKPAMAVCEPPPPGSDTCTKPGDYCKIKPGESSGTCQLSPYGQCEAPTCPMGYSTRQTCNADTKRCQCSQDTDCPQNNSKCVDQICSTVDPVQSAFCLLNDINAEAEKQNLNMKIGCAVFDGESLNGYGGGQAGFKIVKAQKEYAGPDFSIDGRLDLGMAKGGSTTAAATSGIWAYPEQYWIGELKPETSGDCSGCPWQCYVADGGRLCGKDQGCFKDGACVLSGAACSDDADCTEPGDRCSGGQSCQQCANCKEGTIYQENKDQPDKLLTAFEPFLKDTGGITNSNGDPVPGAWPLFSIEHAHSYGQTGLEDTECVQIHYNRGATTEVGAGAGFCGTFDGFGNWTYENFESFLDLVAAQFELKNIGVYEAQFLPKGWLPNGTFSSCSSAPVEP